MVEEAKEAAGVLVKERIAEAKKQGEEALAGSAEENNRAVEQAREEARSQVEALKTQAAQREKEAVEAVLKELTA